ncbi:DNA cytosine methyltransferase [Thermaerobacillus caldiproteolyticus]|uniref:DNA cytosine methyltransferase n=1 Tax=Thermaerobacillus caldiproteolyticus TaxID=247480 RepID=UPI00188D388F|nr:DNA cytosine methyltransferase [Anoxybacillus caldiproteolyticus]QPA30055.1 DNA cytosine methyltransferase [Anoxybacillus caldiproteolyticus]
MEQLTIFDELEEDIIDEEIFDFQKFNEQHQLTDRIDTINTPITSTTRFTVLSLFAGCGGLDLGFKGGFTFLGKEYSRNNFDIIWANEINKQAVETYRSYFGDHIICEDIKNIDDSEFPKADIVLGGFPCQDFSLAGKRRGLTVERGRLYLQMKRVIDAVRPKAFVAENVKNLMMMENGLILKTIIDDFKDSGYNVYYHLFHAANYGVPQNRERVIIYGIREDIDIVPKLPLETHSPENWVTAKEAIDDLWDKLGDPSVPNHSEKDYSKAKFYEGKKTQGNMRIQADKIAPTIRAEHHGNIEGHYRTLGDENDLTNWRRLSVRECARIQSFPDDFVFKSAASAAYKQVGNAVPPVLAWHIARALYLSLTQE